MLEMRNLMHTSSGEGENHSADSGHGKSEEENHDLKGNCNLFYGEYEFSTSLGFVPKGALDGETEQGFARNH